MGSAHRPFPLKDKHLCVRFLLVLVLFGVTIPEVFANWYCAYRGYPFLNQVPGDVCNSSNLNHPDGPVEWFSSKDAAIDRAIERYNNASTSDGVGMCTPPEAIWPEDRTTPSYNVMHGNCFSCTWSGGVYPFSTVCSTNFHRFTTYAGCRQDDPACEGPPDGGGAPPPKNNGPCPGGAGPGGPNPTDNDSNPVNAATGNKYQHESDYTGNGPNPLRFARHYNSFVEDERTIGQGWRHTYDRHLEFRVSPVFGLTEAVITHRPDGRAFEFTPSGHPKDPDITLRLSSTFNGWVLTDESDTIEVYSQTGRLESITPRGGVPQTLSYGSGGPPLAVDDGFGRQLLFDYDDDGRLVEMTDPAGGTYHYSYDDAGNLVEVAYPDGTARTYEYEDPEHLHALTAILDESGRLDGRWEYDDEGRAVLYEGAEGTGQVTFTFHQNGTTTAQDSRGGTRVYDFEFSHDVYRTASIDGDPCVTCGAQAKAFTYDDNGFVIAAIDRNGIETRYERDDRGLETRRIDAFGTESERVIDTEWHPELRQPVTVTEPGRVTAYTYDAAGRRLAESVSDTATGETRTRSMSYNTDGLLASVTDPRGGATTHDYDADGNLVATTNPLGQVTRFGDYDGHGNARRITDSNGVVTILEYDTRQRLVRRTAAGEVTQFAYDDAGRLARMTQPSGAFIEYGYDAAGRLVSITDAAGNRIDYTLDSTGNRIEEQVSGPGGALVREHFQVYDRLNRLVESRGGAGQVTTFEHDPVGNRTRATDAFGNATQSHYDALNRVFLELDALAGETRYDYDALDHLVEVIDPRGVITRYDYNAFGDVLEVHSPDAGTMVYEYDAAGNRTRQTDARGIISEFDYDALDRLVAIRFPDHPDQDIVYTWDDGAFGTGRLARITDETGSTVYEYDAHGRVTAKLATMRGTTLPMFYAHDADGSLERLMHPDGHEVVYQRDAARRVTEVTLIEPDGTEVALVTGAEWQPFGGVSGFTYGNGLPHSRSYDAAGRITSIQTSPVQALSLAWDATDNITAIADQVDSARSQTFGYDALYRLTDASGAYGMLHYQYDAVGNRTQRIADDIVTDYAYAPDSNRLTEVNEVAFTYDTAGNTLTDGERAFTYDARNRMAEADGHRYGYNALGQRVYKPRMGVAGDVTGDGQVTEADLGLLQQALKGESATTMAMDCNQDGVVNRRDTACLASKIGAFKNQGQHQGQGQGGPPAAEDHAEELVQVGWILFLYDESGQLIGEYDEHGTPLRQYVWLDNIPVAMRDADGIYYLHADHLNTPKLATDTAGEVVWRADYRPFGEVTETVDEIEVNLRFPGQYHDRETGLHQNWHREYAPGIGRYTQSDPIGLNGGLNMYLYAEGNPNIYFDPTGLDPFQCYIDALEGIGSLSKCFIRQRIQEPIERSISEMAEVADCKLRCVAICASQFAIGELVAGGTIETVGQVAKRAASSAARKWFSRGLPVIGAVSTIVSSGVAIRCVTTCR